MNSFNLNPLVLLKDLQNLHLNDNQIVDILNRWLWWLSLSDDWKEIFINKVLKLYNISEQDFLNLAVFRSFSDQLFSLTEMDLSNCNISTLCELSLFKELSKLDISENKISDIAPLIELKQLTTLDVSGNQISDITPLAELKQLTTFYVSRNRISDIKPLFQLKKLKTLMLVGNINFLDLEEFKSYCRTHNISLYV